ncbi:MAG TPA: hypothetical protein VJ937_03420 [Salinivirga sp.]|uniref:hypothetical protein n=1 Tax=Salinivirga sp. TaxID=1970192 RepID=UPI002B483DF9|nr:hypothetical protein [Salinivirga sp.]HKK58499.1 hypothetical protein [Salinivirga sp.]
MQNFHELSLTPPGELSRIYNEVIAKTEYERLSREGKYKIEYLQLQMHEQSDVFSHF